MQAQLSNLWMQYVRHEDEFAHLLPPRDLGVVPDPGSVEHAGSFGRDEGRLGDEERAGDGGALLVVLDDEVGGDVCVVGPVAGERGEDDAVGELHVADLDRGEESGCSGGGHPCKVSSLAK